ncbi:Atp-dependent protease la, partial [Globisporangium splendens]
MVLRIFWNVGAGLVQRALSKHALKPGMSINYPAVWRARPGFLDCDVNLHLNNASYLFNMELARWHFTASTGMLTQAIKKKRQFLIGSQVIRYRHAIPPFRPYEIRTQLVFADDTWIYFLQHFQCPTTGKLFAEGLCRATVRQGKTKVTAQQMFEELGEMPALPQEMPDVVKKFLQWDDASRVSMEEATESAQQRLAATPPRKGILADLTRTWNLPF